MATKTQLWDQLTKLVKISDEIYKFGEINSTNLIGMIETLQAAYNGNHIAQTQSGVTNMRNSVASAYTTSANAIQSVILELAKVGYNSIATTVSGALDDIFDGMTSASETISSRAYTYQATATETGVTTGSGKCYRLTEDISGDDIESGYINAGTVNIECISDKNLGRTSGNEQFQIYGSGVTPVDALEQNTARPGSITVISKTANTGLLKNASFEDNSGTGTDLAFTSWTLDTPANFLANNGSGTTDRFRPVSVNDDTGTSIEFTANSYIEQWIASNSITLDQSSSYALIVRYLTTGTVTTGTLTISLGSQSETVNLAGGISSWTDKVVGANQKGYYPNFQQDNDNKGVLVKIEVSSLTGTSPTVRIDDVIFAPLDFFDGCGYIVCAGADDFLRGDYFSFADSVSNTGRTQLEIARHFSKHLPHTTGTPTYADA